VDIETVELHEIIKVERDQQEALVSNRSDQDA